MEFLKSIAFFVLAGFFEICGGYLIWLQVKEGKPWWYSFIGTVILALYALVATFQPQNFGRTYASYGGVFIILSMLWSWKIDDIKPDHYDLIGVLLILIGVIIMFFIPRR